MASEKEEEPPVLHVVVVGFHHKKGCQVSGHNVAAYVQYVVVNVGLTAFIRMNFSGILIYNFQYHAVNPARSDFLTSGHFIH